MKKLLLIIGIIILSILETSAQTFLPRTNGTYTPVDPFLSIPRALYLPKVCDTIVNPLHGGKDSIGAIVWDTCNNKLWVRAISGSTKYWRVGITQDLQTTTNNGNKTTNTIISAGVRTSLMLPDTLDDPNFEIILVPDLQYQTLAGFPPADSSFAGQTFNWICENKIPLNIKCVLQLGDLTDDGNPNQFDRIDSNFDKLDNNNIPYLYVPGNHDYTDGHPTDARILTEYNAIMGPARYTGMPYYGHNFDGTNANYYIKLDIGRQKLIIVGLEFMPRDTVLTWAGLVLDSFPDRKAIIVTHSYITGWGNRSVDTSYATGSYGLIDANNGEEMWNKLVRKKKNIFMVFNGHFPTCCGGGNQSLTNSSLGYPANAKMIESGDNGNTIFQMVSDHQHDSLGGAGKITRLKFRPAENKLDVIAYNTRSESYDTRFPEYTINFPGIKIESNIGLQALVVSGDTRLDSNVYITKAVPLRMAVYGYQNKLDTLDKSDTLTFLAGFGKLNKPKFRTLVSSDIPDLSSVYIANRGVISTTLDFPLTTTLTSSDLTIAVVGVVDGDIITLGVSNTVANANSCFTAWVSAPDIVTVRFNNYSANPIDPVLAVFKVMVLK